MMRLMARELLPVRPRMTGRLRRISPPPPFTPIELMIVVAIVGILAVLAVVGYRKLILSPKLTEANGMIGAIRIAQEDFKVERGIYADIGPTHCPGTGLNWV